MWKLGEIITLLYSTNTFLLVDFSFCMFFICTCGQANPTFISRSSHSTETAVSSLGKSSHISLPIHYGEIPVLPLMHRQKTLFLGQDTCAKQWSLPTTLDESDRVFWVLLNILPRPHPRHALTDDVGS